MTETRAQPQWRLFRKFRTSDFSSNSQLRTLKIKVKLQSLPSNRAVLSGSKSERLSRLERLICIIIENKSNKQLAKVNKEVKQIRRMQCTLAERKSKQIGYKIGERSCQKQAAHWQVLVERR